MFAHGFERKMPSPAAKSLRQDAERERKQHPRPVHFVQQDTLHLAKVKTSIHSVEYQSAKQQRECHLKLVVYDFFELHMYMQKYKIVL